VGADFVVLAADQLDGGVLRRRAIAVAVVAVKVW
jgi:hypothetical protein